MSEWPACWQAGFLSYPRTETDQFDPGYNLRVRHDAFCDAFCDAVFASRCAAAACMLWNVSCGQGF